MSKLLSFSISAVVLICLLLLPTKGYAFDFFRSNNSGDICNSSDTNNSQSSVCDPNSQQKGDNPIVNVIRITTSVMALLGGLLAVIMIIVSGFTLITSGGNQESVANSRKRITSAIVGLIIIALAWTIIRLITDNVIQ